jgi:hypothetical protein
LNALTKPEPERGRILIARDAKEGELKKPQRIQ